MTSFDTREIVDAIYDLRKEQKKTNLFLLDIRTLLERAHAPVQQITIGEGEVFHR